MNKNIALVYLLIATSFSFSSAQNISESCYDSLTESYWKATIEKNIVECSIAKYGDYLTLHMLYKMENDSVLYDSRMNGTPIRIPLSQPTFIGGIEEGLALLSSGDFAKITVSADSIFEKTFHSPLPDYIKKGSQLIFEIELLKIEPKEDVIKQLYEEQQRQKSEEERKIKEYLLDNNINVMPDSNGLYYISEQDGIGIKPKAGQAISVKYTAKLLDGSSLESPAESEPIQFIMGRGEMIKGFEEGIGMMRSGEKCKIIVPSQIGFVSMPYIPVLFEIELLSVN